MAALVQAIAVPTLLALSVGYLFFVAWASHRRREEAEAERLRPQAPNEPDEQSDATARTSARSESSP